MQKETLHPAQRLYNLRNSLGLSQRELAKEFMVSSGAIASWEIAANPIPGPVIKLIELYENSLSHQRDSNEEIVGEVDEILQKINFTESDKEQLNQIFKNFIIDEKNLNSLKAKTKLSLIKQILNLLKDSRGATIKFVQLLSYLEVGLPSEIRNVLGNIQNKLKPLNKKTVNTIVENSYGKSIHEVFPFFDYKPLAVTSLAQVHYAKLKNGQEVAVKIQDPEIKKTLKKQFDKINFLSKIGAFFNNDLVGIAKEIQKTLEFECDYKREVETHIKIKEILKDMPRVYVPNVYLNLCTSNIIVTEFIHGENFHAFSTRANQESKNLVATAITRSLTHLTFSHNLVYTDAHFENFLIKNDKIVILDFGRTFSPDRERMRLEIMFYRAFVRGQKEIAQKIFQKIDFVKNEKDFNFDEFWIFLTNSSKHLLHQGPFKFTKNYLQEISREGRRFSQKKNMKLSPEVFWGFTFSSGTWALFAELEAEINWNQIALETFDTALQF